MLRFGAAERLARRAVSPQGAHAGKRRELGASAPRDWRGAAGEVPNPGGWKTARRTGPADSQTWRQDFVSARFGGQARRSVARRNHHRTSSNGRASALPAGGGKVDGTAGLAWRPDPGSEACFGAWKGSGRGQARRSWGAAAAAVRGACFGTGNGLTRRLGRGAGKRAIAGACVALRCGRVAVKRALVTPRERPQRTRSSTGFGPDRGGRAVVERLDRRTGRPPTRGRASARQRDEGGPERRLAEWHRFRQRGARGFGPEHHVARDGVAVERPASQRHTPKQQVASARCCPGRGRLVAGRSGRRRTLAARGLRPPGGQVTAAVEVAAWAGWQERATRPCFGAVPCSAGWPARHPRAR
jgi:hypothetical protein